MERILVESEEQEMTGEEAIAELKMLEYYNAPFDNTPEMCNKAVKKHNALICAIKAIEIVKEVKQIIDEWNDKITEPEEDIYYLCHIAELFEQKGE